MAAQRFPPDMPSTPIVLDYCNNHEKEDIELARKWLGSCLAGHEYCKARQVSSTSSSNRTLPTRLIRIICSNHSIESIHLVSRPDFDALVTSYMTLSHCWGGADIVKLKQNNLVRFHTDIPLDLLPKSFSDAIKITILLGHEYLWIDSLCIIQDSTEDWLHEAMAIGSVYRNSTLTIAAVGAKDSHGGFFLTSRYSRELDRSRWTKLGQQDMNLFETNELEQKEPLLGRAWVLQEQFLSIRTVNFGTRELSWDCLGMRASPLDTLHPDRYSFSTKLCYEQALSTEYSWIMCWWQLIKDYTRRSATFSTDRWEAIRGLVTEVVETHSQKFLYGLWSHRVKYELLWSVEGTAMAERHGGRRA